MAFAKMMPKIVAVLQAPKLADSPVRSADAAAFPSAAGRAVIVRVARETGGYEFLLILSSLAERRFT